jgi:predicted AlkP superfamily pyrophosphatase or phosphodiesterase
MVLRGSILGLALACCSFCQNTRSISPEPHAQRIVILKIDGLNADLLYRRMSEVDPATGKSRLPWFSHIFAENGTIFNN